MGIAFQIVAGCEFARKAIRPLLVQRDAEQGRTGNSITHQLQKLGWRDSPLDVVGQVEVRIVEFTPPGARLRFGGVGKPQIQETHRQPAPTTPRILVLPMIQPPNGRAS